MGSLHEDGSGIAGAAGMVGVLLLRADDGAAAVALHLVLGQVGRGHEQLPHEVDGAELQVQVVHKGLQGQHDLSDVALHVLPLLCHRLHQPGQDVRQHLGGGANLQGSQHLRGQ